jgi:hypothetical protein
MLEKQIEAKAVKWAKDRGCLVLKANGIGQRSFPDRIFFMPNGVVGMIEFKRADGKLSEGQKDLIQELENRKQKVAVCYSVAAAIEILDYWLKL